MKNQPPLPEKDDPVAELGAALRKGMAYGDFRGVVLGKGWEPVVNPGCRANLAGADADDFCASNPRLIACRICDELPELDACSGDARCLVRFHHPESASILEATGYGEVEYWSETGEDAGLQVSGWEFVESKDR